ncbi:MAG: tryptophanase [Candidatus Levybacteria bacterium]|nr:tryptophanase [Candidatus Levybacteria bacterium]
MNERVRQIPLPEPYKNKMVEAISLLPRSERIRAINHAGLNTFLLRSRDVFIDLLTDSGTNAMSQEQWSRMMLGDEAYAGASSFYELENAVSSVYGFEHVIPVHQGRAGEHLLAQNIIKPGQFVLKNMYFTTTRQHIELAGGTFVDVITPQAHDASSKYPFKGNVDLEKTEDFIKKYGADSVALFWIETCVNMAGGQPLSLENIKNLRELSMKYHIPLYFDATRATENAYFIKEREIGQKTRSVKSILHEMMSYGDGCTMSSKKDNLVNIGGFVATNDGYLAQKMREMVVVYEGLHTYGGMSGRDMEAVAQGIKEMTRDDYITFRVEQVQRFGQQFIDANVPVVNPIGGHAVFLNASAILPNLPQDRFPAQSLTAAIYEHSGVRSMERGVVSSGRDPQTGENRHPKLETVRLTVPRRVYSDSHLAYTASSIIDLVNNHVDQPLLTKGLEFVYEPDNLRFFQARFKIAE